MLKLKKVYFLTLIALSNPLIYGMSAYDISPMSPVQSQLEHIKAQMLTIKRAWNSERIRIKLAKKASPKLYQTILPTLEKIISSTIFTTKLNEVVSNQFDAIASNSMPFTRAPTELNLSTLFPNVTMNDFGKKLFSAMANKIYYLELGKKLAQKMQELQMVATFVTQ